jgi:hypothetical protein
MEKYLYEPWIPDCVMDICIRECFVYAAIYLQVPLPILPLGCAGRFVRSVVRPVPALSAHNYAYSASADAAQRQNGFVMPVWASDAGQDMDLFP